MGWVEIVLRAVAVGATISAAVVMGTNKQTKSIPVTATLSIPITAKYHYTPAFVFFVVMNAIASGYAAVTLLSTILVKHVFKHVLKSPRARDLHDFLFGFLDMVTVAGLTAGASAATAISEVGKNGNRHSQWQKICDRFGRFCDRGGGALIASFAGVLAFMLLNLISTYSLYKRSRALASTPAQ